MAKTTKTESMEYVSGVRGSQESSCGSSEMACSSGGAKMLALVIVICTVLNISSSWYLARGTINPLLPVSMGSDVSKIADALKEVQYDQAGGKDVYELYMKLQKLQAQGQKSKLEEQIRALEGGAQPAGTDPATAPSASKTLTADQYAGIFKDSYIDGNAKAKITLVEYSDFECPYCIMQKKNGTIDGLKKKYGDSINVVFKPLNLARHAGADQKGWAALCVGKLGGAEKYTKFSNAILDKSEVQGPVYPLDKLSALAKEVGVDQKKFDTCYNAKETEAIYKNYTTEAMAFAVNGTPTTMVLNNETKTFDLVQGAAPASNFETIVDKMMAAK